MVTVFLILLSLFSLLLLSYLFLLVFVVCVGADSASLTTFGFITVLALSVLLGIKVNEQAGKNYVRNYKVDKVFYERMLKEDIATFDYHSLIFEISEKNEQLERKQTYAEKWYGFDANKEVLELEPIEWEGNHEQDSTN